MKIDSILNKIFIYYILNVMENNDSIQIQLYNIILKRIDTVYDTTYNIDRGICNVEMVKEIVESEAMNNENA